MSPTVAGGFFTTSTTWEATLVMKVKVAQSDPLQPHGLYSPWSSLGQNTGVW